AFSERAYILFFERRRRGGANRVPGNGVGNQMRVWLCDGFTLAPVEAFCGTLQHSRKKPARVSGPQTAPVLHQLVRTLDSTIKRGSALYSSHHNLGYLQQLQGSSVSHNMEDRGADRGADRSESRPLHCISPGLRGMA
ncbi:Glucosyl-3-phosphoglycerate synthase, partial [Dissostichus eleginoides]